jgi:hypothetical protein
VGASPWYEEPGMEPVDGGEQRHGGQHRHESRWGELNVDDGPTRQRSLGSEGASSGTRWSSGWSRLWLWERWHGVVKSSGY